MFFTILLALKQNLCSFWRVVKNIGPHMKHKYSHNELMQQADGVQWVEQIQEKSGGIVAKWLRFFFSFVLFAF